MVLINDTPWGRTPLYRVMAAVLVVQLFLTSWSSATEVSHLGQLLMVGFNEAQVTPELIRHLKAIRPGAIILFRRNIKDRQQLATLIRDLRRELEPHLQSPILFAIDQEGGSVFRIPTDPKVPSAAAIGKSGDSRIVERYGRSVGKILRQSGIAMNLAPVLDIELDPQKNYILTAIR